MKALRFPLLLVGFWIGAFGLGWIVTERLVTSQARRIRRMLAAGDVLGVQREILEVLER